MTDERRPIDPQTRQPLPPMRQPGYYPGYSILGEQDYWDDATRSVVLDRVNNVPPIRFFSPEEAELMEAVIGRVLPQDDRLPERRIPIVNYIDDRNYRGVIDGYRFEGMPSDRDALKLGLKAIAQMADVSYSTPFVKLDQRRQDELLKSIHDDEPRGAEDVWQQLPCGRFWLLLVQQAVDAYYAHPWAWDEIGYGGPAYPRGYMRLTGGLPEPWEVEEKRYEWDAPPESLSGDYSPVASGDDKHLTPSQGGSH
jgi:hypothetical protein